jgi:hypothetical protein
MCSLAGIREGDHLYKDDQKLYWGKEGGGCLEGRYRRKAYDNGDKGVGMEVVVQMVVIDAKPPLVKTRV